MQISISPSRARTCRTAMFVEIPCTGKLSVKNPSLLILAECRHIDDSPAKQLAAQAQQKCTRIIASFIVGRRRGGDGRGDGGGGVGLRKQL